MWSPWHFRSANECVGELARGGEPVARRLGQCPHHRRVDCRGHVVAQHAQGVGRSVISLAMIAWTVGPVTGGSPASISYVTAPRA